jgi:hypothetical protein
MEPCSKAAEIAVMQKDLGDVKERIGYIEEAIDGNGKPGMKRDLQRLSDGQDSMNKTMATMGASMAMLSTNVSALLIFQAEQKTADRMKIRLRDVVYMVITIVVAVAAVLVTWFASKGGA